MQLTLFDAICPTCLTPYSMECLSPAVYIPAMSWLPLILAPCSLACL